MFTMLPCPICRAAKMVAPNKVSHQQEFNLGNAAAGIYLVSIMQNQKPPQHIKFSLVR